MPVICCLTPGTKKYTLDTEKAHSLIGGKKGEIEKYWNREGKSNANMLYPTDMSVDGWKVRNSTYKTLDYAINTGRMNKGKYNIQYDEGIINIKELMMKYLFIASNPRYKLMDSNISRLAGAIQGNIYTDDRFLENHVLVSLKYGCWTDNSVKFMYGTNGKYTSSLKLPTRVEAKDIKIIDFKIVDKETDTEEIFESVMDNETKTETKKYKLKSKREYKMVYTYSFDDFYNNAYVESDLVNLQNNIYVYDKNSKDLVDFVSHNQSTNNNDIMKSNYSVEWDNLIMDSLKSKSKISDIKENYEHTINENINIYEYDFNTETYEDEKLKEGHILINLPYDIDNRYESENYVKGNDSKNIYFEIENEISPDLILSELESKYKNKVLQHDKEYTVLVDLTNITNTDTSNKINLKYEVSQNDFYGIVNVQNGETAYGENIIKSKDKEQYEITFRTPADGKIMFLNVLIDTKENGINNIWNDETDFKRIKFILDTSGAIDIGIKDIILKSGGTQYNTLTSDGITYKMDANIPNYLVDIVVEKISGEAPVVNPRVNFIVKVDPTSSTTISSNVTFDGTLTNVGDRLIQTVDVSTSNQYLAIVADIDDSYHLNTNPKTNIDNDNDTMSKKYAAGNDFKVSEVIVSPEFLYLADGENSVKSNVSVTGRIDTSSFGDGLFRDVEIRLRRRDPNGSVQTIETKLEDLYSGITEIEFEIPSSRYREGSYSYEIEVNRPHTYFESNYDNNKGYSALKVIKTLVPQKEYCFGSAPNTANEWKIYHTCYEGKWYIHYGKYGPYCSGYTYQTYPYSLGSKQATYYKESFNLTPFVKSKKTDWNWKNGDIEVNAGRGFEIKWELKYYTNRRQNMPRQHVESNGKCGQDWTNRRYSSYYFATPLNVKILGYNFPGKNIFTLYPIASGTWDNRTLKYSVNTRTDALGDFSKKYFTEMSTSNRTITFQAWTNYTNGYGITYGERDGDVKRLIDCKTTRIKIKDAIDINKKTIE